jgi:uncharacterized protein YfaP (DUF2135 family)
MKPRNREINIFNLSMLDVICGAMGAFLVLLILLLPYYKKEHRDYQKEIQEQQQRITAQQQQIAEEERQRQEAEEQLRQTEQKLAEAMRNERNTPLLIIIKWETLKHDVDLHVVDPDGGEFYYRNKTIPDHAGMLSEDDTDGPGFEIWEVDIAKPGKYEIAYNLYDAKGNNQAPTVVGRVVSKNGSIRLPDIVLDRVREKKKVATVILSENGQLSIQ